MLAWGNYFYVVFGYSCHATILLSLPVAFPGKLCQIIKSYLDLSDFSWGCTFVFIIISYVVRKNNPNTKFTILTIFPVLWISFPCYTYSFGRMQYFLLISVLFIFIIFANKLVSNLKYANCVSDMSLFVIVHYKCFLLIQHVEIVLKYNNIWNENVGVSSYDYLEHH